MFEVGAPVSNAAIDASVVVLHRGLAFGAFTPWTEDLHEFFAGAAPYVSTLIGHCFEAQQEQFLSSMKPFARSLEIVRWKSTESKWCDYGWWACFGCAIFLWFLTWRHRVHMLCSLLYDEDLTVLHVSERKGFIVRFSGVESNLTLHTILMHLLLRGEEGDGMWHAVFRGLLGGRHGVWVWVCGWRGPLVLSVAEEEGDDDDPLGARVLPGARPPKDSFNVLAGQCGARNLGHVVVSAWDMMSWMTLSNDGHVPSTCDLPESENIRHRLKIWLHGVPADIPALNGKRIVLLTRPSDRRAFSNTRVFDTVLAEARVSGTSFYFLGRCCVPSRELPCLGWVGLLLSSYELTLLPSWLQVTKVMTPDEFDAALQEVQEAADGFDCSTLG